MDGNPKEWRIMYHGTNQGAVNSIIKNNLISGEKQHHQNDECINELGEKVKVGKGIYFSNDIKVCIDNQYAKYTQVGEKQFAPIFMSRVNPKKIKQSKMMKSKQFFVVNNSEDVRPYRLLLHEKKNEKKNEKKKENENLNQNFCIQF
ncbi:unnamed protein product (macronuclear) [Paramecium tetraurelia]|nr:uncharacterized protein GSPATT00035879001 [Paramecium tetraurelia]CAK66749.1 unnamed protein product [Paramecium tetraurelia]|eukprot:XP_001434146.1 hypothetical protein (macronuclear) [Paramecium tetraurelia strain d4-2]